MDSGTLSGIITAVFMVVFVGIVWWVFRKGNKQRFDDAGELPFKEDDDRHAQQGDKQ